LFRPGDKPRLTNKKAEDMVLEDEVVAQIARGAELLVLPKAEGGLGDASAFHALMLLIRTGRRINEVLLMDFHPLLPLVGQRPSVDGQDEVMVARMSYRQTKVQSLQPATIPVDAEVVAIIHAQQEVSRRFADRMRLTSQDPRYLFLRERETATVSTLTPRPVCTPALPTCRLGWASSTASSGRWRSAAPTGFGTPPPRTCSTPGSRCMS